MRTKSILSVCALFVFFALISIAGLPAVFAAENASSNIITINDLGTENPGMLPTSPFYFLKQWRRGIKQALAFNAAGKAATMIQSLNEKAAEIKKLSEISTNPASAVKNAVDEYAVDAKKLLIQLKLVKKGESGSEKLASSLFDSFLKHEQFFAELQADSEISANADISSALEALREAVNYALENFGKNIGQKELEQILNDSPLKKLGDLKDLRLAEIISGLAENASPEKREILNNIESILLQHFKDAVASSVDGTLAENISLLPGDESNRIGVLNAVIGIVRDAEIKQKLETIKNKFIEARKEAEFCGTSTESVCEIDSDCVVGGCSGQICGAKNDSGTISTCEWRDCYKKPESTKCGCVNGKCAWNVVSLGEPCPLFSVVPINEEECQKSGGYVTSTRLENGCEGPAKCIIPEKEVCENSDGVKLSLAEAMKIASGSECAKQGDLTGEFVCNKNTGTWWLDLDAEKPGCSPACVVNIVSKKAEINWRCTGLISPTQPTGSVLEYKGTKYANCVPNPSAIRSNYEKKEIKGLVEEKFGSKTTPWHAAAVSGKYLFDAATGKMLSNFDDMIGKTISAVGYTGTGKETFTGGYLPTGSKEVIFDNAFFVTGISGWKSFCCNPASGVSISASSQSVCIWMKE